MWSPTIKVGIIDPLGILKASMTKAQREGHRHRHEDGLDVLPYLALTPSAEPHVDLTIGAGKSVHEGFLVEGDLLHGFAQGFQASAYAVALLDGEVAHH